MDVDALRDDYIARWHETPVALPILGPEVGFWRHRGNARAVRRLIDELAAEAGRVPETEPERSTWRESVRERLQRFGETRLGWPAGYRRLLFGDDFFAAAEAFARRARAFDPSLSVASLFQALRNVWIGNSLQMLLDRPVRLNPGLFGYSMLYPLTDNLLDDPAVAGGDKRAFNERFGLRLAGSSVAPLCAHDAAAFEMIAHIEREFPRQCFPGVFDSLLAIHEAQTRSLAQHAGAGLTDEELIAISVAKGGSSLVADLYLICGTPRPADERFAFGYGVFLQLLDDLQDVTDDLAAGHETLFTRASRRGSLDAPVARLARFVDDVLAAPMLADQGFDDRRDLIRRNCLMLLVGAVAGQPGYFTWRFRRALARQWPLSFRATRRLRRHAARRYREAQHAIRRHTGASSPVDWILLAQVPAGR